MKLTAIKLRRLEAGMLQIELAHRARVPRARLSEIENGHTVPRREELERLARALGIRMPLLLNVERASGYPVRGPSRSTP